MRSPRTWATRARRCRRATGAGRTAGSPCRPSAPRRDRPRSGRARASAGGLVVSSMVARSCQPQIPRASRRRPASSSPPTSSAATHITVSSPATVPTRPVQPAAVERRGDDMGAAGRRSQHDEVGRTRDLGDPLAHHPAQLVDRRDPVGRELGDRRTPSSPPGTRTLTAPRSSRSRDTVAWVAAIPLGQQLDQLRLVGDLVVADQPADRPV